MSNEEPESDSVFVNAGAIGATWLAIDYEVNGVQRYWTPPHLYLETSGSTLYLVC